MRLLLVNQFYRPDVAPTGHYAADLAESLAARGDTVEVLCGRAGYAGPVGARPSGPPAGVRVRRVWAGGSGRTGALRRVVGYAAFFVRVLWRLLAGRPYDLAIVLTTPPLLSVAAALARRLRGRRYVVWSMDLHPEALVAAGMARDGGPVARALGALAGVGDRHADAVVAVGDAMRERLLHRGIPSDRVHTLGLWSDGRRVRPIEPGESALRARLGVGDRFVVQYAGNAGVAHGFDEVIEAMHALRDDERFFFLFVGGGAQRPTIERSLAERAPGRAAYLDYVSAEARCDMLGAGDVHLITQRDEMAGIVLPSKLYGILAAGRPTVFVGPRRSEVGLILETAGAGVAIDPAEGRGGERLADALRVLADDRAARDEMGTRARAALLAAYDRPILCEQWMRLIDRVAHRSPQVFPGRRTEAPRAPSASVPTGR